ncbi:MAG: hypothetical protein GX070_05200 [Alcaligenaceae bacterium]|nr:hypothetical protein [Alcaligenaceae bacterium]
MQKNRILLGLILAGTAVLAGCSKKSDSGYPEEVKQNINNQCLRSFAASAGSQYNEEQGKALCSCFTNETEKAMPLEKMKRYETMIANNEQSDERKELDAIFTKISLQCLKN